MTCCNGNCDQGRECPTRKRALIVAELRHLADVADAGGRVNIAKAMREGVEEIGRLVDGKGARDAASQAREAKLREALNWHRIYSTDNALFVPPKLMQEAYVLPADDTALREWGAKLLEKAGDLSDRAVDMDQYGQECRKLATGLRAGKAVV
jgi:hypothetical protein